MVKIKPRVGRGYLLFRVDSFMKQQFDGFYIGRLPVTTELFLTLERPEGHLFAVKDKKNGIEIYCIRETNEKVRMMLEYDEHGNPEWPIGFPVHKPMDNCLNELEKKYLEERIIKYESARW